VRRPRPDCSYPGAEVEVGTYTYDEFGNPIFTAAGHSLAYGVASLTGLTNRFYTPQGEIDQVLANNTSGPSSPAIAHPYNLLYPWTDWTVLRYRGMELMADLQTNFSDTASPMVKWRAELTRLLANTFTYGYFASARTGGDFHGSVDEVWRNNKQTQVFTYSGSYMGGSTYNPCTNYSFTFPGGSNYYYLYISGPDYIYSSPIFIGN
jgi:hypothetical protein